MTTLREFCDSVLEKIPRATGREKEDIRAELTDHLLEHRDMLVEHGVEELEAEQRAIRAMGDPVEIGAAWNAQLSPFWLWLGRVCLIVALALLWSSLGTVSRTADRLGAAMEVRRDVEAGALRGEEPDYTLLWTKDPGVEEPFGEHIIRIHRVELWKSKYEPEEYRLRIAYVTYHKDLLGMALNNGALSAITYGAGGDYRGGGSSQNATVSRASHRVDVEKGLEELPVYLEYNGNTFSTVLKLDWGGVDG